MNEVPFFYNRVSPPTWIHLSAILTIAVFFKFSRLWSVRNLDLIALVLVAPGLWAAQYGHAVFGHLPDAVRIEQIGYIWLFAATFWLLLRMLVDPMMVRRPLLEPNLSVGGLTFLGIAMFVFLMANVLTGNKAPDEWGTPANGTASPTVAASQPSSPTPEAAPPAVAPQPAATAEKTAEADRMDREGPGYPRLFQLPNIVTQHMLPAETTAKPAIAMSPAGQQPVDVLAVRIALIIMHLAVVLGMVFIGYRHFDNVKTGIAAAVLYLMLPYTAQFTGYLRHVLPGVLLVWAILAYRRPVISGVILGLAIGFSYYPLFLLPLWISFYWQRGLLRFLGGLLPAVALLVALLPIWAPTHQAFVGDARQMFGWVIPQMQAEHFEGFWSQDLGLGDPAYRIPILATFVALSATMAIWPAQKNLGTLMGCSAAIMLGTQFWNAHQGGMFMGWYLAPLLLTIFRPNLEDRVALSVLGESWFPRRRGNVKRIERAA